MINAGELRKNTKLMIEGEPYVMLEVQFVKPGKGVAFYKCKMRNLMTGSLLERTYRSGDTFEPAALEEKKMQYLYAQGDEYYFMDVKTYDQVMLTEEAVGDAKEYLIDNLEMDILFFENKAIGITLPNFVELEVTQADPWVKGDSVAGDSKPVTLQTGMVLQVPPFVEEGTIIQVDTRTGAYVTRVKK
ncbi:elongation factor P [Desulfatibacillum aliphaticivorans]|uniref:Elongation factor P n=1 Tax=Desulfatibacillum aliphaticivorans TaxID=218208 RepID=EFP_DESAL|nr:elongation factor P [Desulfatibacillum aliphaticivorans]B8FLV5.1 RecName: Full=Elongation factor P; Short=EF-P [Desulfatibacillum aliphaticivorans]ACL05459.1 translation elongation factor P [Desulfatibacillum aliphaticivorans]